MSDDASEKAIDWLAAWIVGEEWKKHDEPSWSMEPETRETIRQRVRGLLKAALPALDLVAVDPALVAAVQAAEDAERAQDAKWAAMLPADRRADRPAFRARDIDDDNPHAPVLTLRGKAKMALANAVLEQIKVKP